MEIKPPSLHQFFLQLLALQFLTSLAFRAPAPEIASLRPAPANACSPGLSTNAPKITIANILNIVRPLRNGCILLAHYQAARSNSMPLAFVLRCIQGDDQRRMGGAAAVVLSAGAATPNRAGTHGRRCGVGQSYATASDDRFSGGTRNGIRALT